VVRAAIDPVAERFSNRAEQVTWAHVDCASLALALGRTQLALHEALYARDCGQLGERYAGAILERLATVYRHVEQFDLARTCAEQAVVQSLGIPKHLVNAYTTRGCQADSDGERELAVSCFQKAYKLARELGQVHDAARALNNLADSFVFLGRPRAARRALLAAEHLMPPDFKSRNRALGRILLGEIEDMDSNRDLAAHHWRTAVEISKHLRDDVLRFRAEYRLLRQANDLGNTPVVRSMTRRLRRLACWIPKDTPELKDFLQLIASTEGSSPKTIPPLTTDRSPRVTREQRRELDRALG
jgi:tetratricopeptide (TPR) repeat protein